MQLARYGGDTGNVLHAGQRVAMPRAATSAGPADKAGANVGEVEQGYRHRQQGFRAIGTQATHAVQSAAQGIAGNDDDTSSSDPVSKKPRS